MKDLDNIHFKNSLQFRQWLEDNHDKSPGIWMIFYKKHTKKENILYEEALDEALCFGWIDSIIKRIDNEKYLRKFTPRTNTENWSDANKSKVVKLIKNGRMNEAGLKKIDSYLKTGKVDWDKETIKNEKIKELKIPDFIKKEFARNEPALTNFNNLAPTYKEHYIYWISSAKRDDTIRKRLDESIELLKENKKLGLK
jgi:uncharacterized protein YdeI (YjbR/CyaY-like superfamily)